MLLFQLKYSKVSSAAGPDYAAIVNNTIDFKQKPGESTGAAVQRFFENGGVHREGSQSRKEFSNVIFFDKALDLKVGEEKVIYNGSQLTKDITRRLNAGLYTFNYDTEEKGLTLYSLNNPEDVIKVSFGAKGGAFEKIDNLPPNSQALFSAIGKTSELYKNNKEFAAFMEKCADRLYGRGYDSFKSEVPYSASMQNPEGLSAIKTVMANYLQANLKGRTLSEWQNAVYGMVNPVSRALVRSPSQLDQIQRELLLQDTKNTDQLDIGFDVTDKGKLCMNVFSYADVDRNRAYNPLIMYQVVDGKPAFNNSFVRHGTITVDWDNANVKGEQYFEDRLTDYYNGQTSWIAPHQNIYAFASNVTLPIGDLSKEMDAALKKK